MFCSVWVWTGLTILEQSAECPAGEGWTNCPCHIPSSSWTTCCTSSGSGSGSGSTSGSASTWASASGATSTSTTSSWATGTQHAPNRRGSGRVSEKAVNEDHRHYRAIRNQKWEITLVTERMGVWARDSTAGEQRERNRWWWEKVTWPFTQKQYLTVEVDSNLNLNQYKPEYGSLERPNSACLYLVLFWKCSMETIQDFMCLAWADSAGTLTFRANLSLFWDST